MPSGIRCPWHSCCATRSCARLAAAEQRDIRIELDEPDEQLTVLGDRRQLLSALGNLIDNAVKYSEPGNDVLVSAQVDASTTDTAMVVFRVTDTGIGIPTRDLDRIFERFYRVDRARSRDTGGTGLGLAIVRHVATNHEGEVQVQSSEGEGSTFTLQIPVAPMSPTNPTVLLVEDEESFVDALLIGLKREGFRVEVARDGFEALDKFDIVRPDIVLLDVMLPRISGIDVCRQLRKRTQVPIIMVTAKGAEIDTVVGLEVGADDYVTKPYRIRELVARMRAVLRRNSMAGEGAPDLSRDSIVVGKIALDPDEHVVTIDGQPANLPLKEFELLHILLANAGRVLPRETLIDRVWGSDYVGDTKTLDVHIKRLRSKIEDDPAVPTRIVTIRGLGYKYERTKG